MLDTHGHGALGAEQSRLGGCVCVYGQGRGGVGGGEVEGEGEEVTMFWGPGEGLFLDRVLVLHTQCGGFGTE